MLVGSGILPAGQGSDTGGSVQIPAAFCSCVGLKTSIDLVSRAGRLTHSVEMPERMLDAMQGSDLFDATTLGNQGRSATLQLNRGI